MCFEGVFRTAFLLHSMFYVLCLATERAPPLEIPLHIIPFNLYHLVYHCFVVYLLISLSLKFIYVCISISI